MSEAVIECRGVSCGYETPVLTGVDLRIERAETVALLGRSGCGKSTLMMTMLGLMPALAGEVRVFGEPIEGQSAGARRALLRRVGVAFQQDALLSSLTIADNVALPLRELTSLKPGVIDEMVRMKLALVGLAGLERRQPSQLSGGERKRAALARASILDPELVTCDEPTAGLDPVASAGIEDTMVAFRQVLGSTLVVVSHDLGTVRAVATRVVMLAEGGVHAAGTFDELSSSRDPIVHEFFQVRAA